MTDQAGRGYAVRGDPARVLTRGLAARGVEPHQVAGREVAPHGITVNAVAPWFIATPMASTWPADRRGAEDVTGF
jgi:NAD(P)-dependent dehydrogenase (short-subunit alcohol dehydrogenase family)